MEPIYSQDCVHAEHALVPATPVAQLGRAKRRFTGEGPVGKGKAWGLGWGRTQYREQGQEQKMS